MIGLLSVSPQVGQTPTDVLCCIICQAKLDTAETTWHCSKCDQSYPVTLGIPDLRPVHTQTGPDSLIKRMLERYPQASLDELIQLRFEDSDKIPARLLNLYSAYRHDASARGQRFYTMFQQRLAERYGPPGYGIALDLGCGAGASTAAMAGDFRHVIGVDPGLPDLLLAKKLLAERGITNVTLVQAYAQTLPLTTAAVDYVGAQNVLEHVLQLEDTMKEVARALKLNGKFVADSRNRFDLLGHEPHTQLRWVGFLPRKIQAHYVQWRRGLPYDDVRLLSYRELRSALHRHFGVHSAIVFPGVIAYGGSAVLDRCLVLIARVPLLSTLVLNFFPSHLAIGIRQPSELITSRPSPA